jgi:prepilin-type N-terminal cleavage/methylation domain-containing protein
VTPRPRQQGFTLLEIAVALAILGVGVVTTMQLFSGSLKITDRASRQTRAVLAARAQMDSLLVLPELRNMQRQETTQEGYRIQTTVRDAGPAEGIERREFDVEPEQTLRFLQVEVTWQDGAGQKTYTVQSLRLAPPAEED